MGGEAQRGAQWGGDQWGGQGDYEPALRSVEARYGQALASLWPAAVETPNAFAPIAETSFEIPMADLVAGARIMRKKKTKQGKKMPVGGRDCGCCKRYPPDITEFDDMAKADAARGVRS